MRIDPLCPAKAALNVVANLALICRHVSSRLEWPALHADLQLAISAL